MEFAGAIHLEDGYGLVGTITDVNEFADVD